MKITVSILLLTLVIIGACLVIFGKPKEVAQTDTYQYQANQQQAAQAVTSTSPTNPQNEPQQTQSSQQPMQPNTQQPTTPEQNKQIIVKGISLQTNHGEIVIELFAKATPKTAENFARLVMTGFYDNTKFHRVIKGFMIQGGDPLSKDDSKMNMWGTGNPGYQFNDEIGGTNAQNHNVVGTISMANSGPNTNGSQFFINVADNTFLDSKHTVFGRVAKGMDIVQKISEVATGENDRPVEAVVVTKASLITE